MMYRSIKGYLGVMENQMENKRQNEMETVLI